MRVRQVASVAVFALLVGIGWHVVQTVLPVTSASVNGRARARQREMERRAAERLDARMRWMREVEGRSLVDLVGSPFHEGGGVSGHGSVIEKDGYFVGWNPATGVADWVMFRTSAAKAFGLVGMQGRTAGGAWRSEANILGQSWLVGNETNAYAKALVPLMWVWDGEDAYSGLLAMPMDDEAYGTWYVLNYALAGYVDEFVGDAEPVCVVVGTLWGVPGIREVRMKHAEEIDGAMSPEGLFFLMFPLEDRPSRFLAFVLGCGSGDVGFRGLEMVSVGDLEWMSGLDFAWKLQPPEAAKRICNPAAWGMDDTAVQRFMESTRRK